MDDEFVFPDDPLSVYLAEVRKVPPLTVDEERACMERIQTEDVQAKTARKRLMEGTLHLVISIAGRHRNDRVDMLDSIQKGNGGLLRAIATLSERRVESWSAHAAQHVGSILSEGNDDG